MKKSLTNKILILLTLLSLSACDGFNYSIVSSQSETSTISDEGTSVDSTDTSSSSSEVSSSSVTESLNVRQINLTADSVSVSQGSTKKIYYSFIPSNTNQNSVTVKSSNTAVFTIAKNTTAKSLTIRGVAVGTATLTVTSTANSSVYKSIPVTVTGVSVTGVTLSSSSLTVTKGATSQLTATVSPSNASNKNVTYSSANSSIATVSASGLVTGVAVGSTVITVKTVDGGYTASASVTVAQAGTYTKTPVNYTINDVCTHNYYTIDSCPSIGNINTLVIPVWFTDSSNYISTSYKESVRSDINTVFNGSKTDIGGYESVKTYYETLSKGLLTYNATIAQWYSCGKASSEFYSEDSGMELTTSLVKTASDWYFQNNTSDSRKNYDSDGNGYLDAVLLVYGAPDYSQLGNKNAANLWAYVYWVQNSSYKKTTAPGPNTFMWVSYDFMYGSNASQRTGLTKSTYGCGDTTYTDIDAHTFIHESGHIFGLNDYYDYSGEYTPAGDFSMQDYNVGCHDPYSAMILGYANPYVMKQAGTITINDFQSSRDIVVIRSNYDGSPFNEYILLELYTPTGLNKFDCDHKYNGNYPQGPSTAGIRVWHVDARLVSYTSSSSGYYTTNATNSNLDFYASNTYDQEYDYFCENFLVRNNTSATTYPTDSLDSSDLFKTGDSFTLSKYKKQFINQTTFNDGTSFNFTISFTAVNSTSATITIS